jgi:uroporphyrinogen-III decarboxylase
MNNDKKSLIEKAIEYLRKNKEKFKRGAELQQQLWNGKKPDRQPLLLNCSPDEEDLLSLPGYNTRETHYDSEKMFASGLREMLHAAYGEMDAVPSARANMGCGIFPSLFPGIIQELYEDKMPWIHSHLSKEVLSSMKADDLEISDEFKAGLDHMAYMAERLTGTGCHVFPMDLQGPFDTAHLVYGDAIFYDLYDDPDFVHHLLNLSCEAIFLGMEACLKIIPDSDKLIAHYNHLVIPRSKGGIKISEDTSTLLSREQIEEFVVPYTGRVLEYFGGGYIHYCGRNPHLLETVMNMPLAYGINFGNPEMHDMEQILKRCAQENKIYYGTIPKQIDESLEEYFTRLLKASRKGDRSTLLLSFYTDMSQREKVMEAWENAGQDSV